MVFYARSLAFIARFLYLWNTIPPSVSIQLLERLFLNDIVLLQAILEQGTYEETAPERFFVRHRRWTYGTSSRFSTLFRRSLDADIGIPLTLSVLIKLFLLLSSGCP